MVSGTLLAVGLWNSVSDTRPSCLLRECSMNNHDSRGAHCVMLVPRASDKCLCAGRTCVGTIAMMSQPHTPSLRHYVAENTGAAYQA